jgi:hypothetical protein
VPFPKLCRPVVPRVWTIRRHLCFRTSEPTLRNTLNTCVRDGCWFRPAKPWLVSVSESQLRFPSTGHDRELQKANLDLRDKLIKIMTRCVAGINACVLAKRQKPCVVVSVMGLTVWRWTCRPSTVNTSTEYRPGVRLDTQSGPVIDCYLSPRSTVRGAVSALVLFRVI